MGEIIRESMERPMCPNGISEPIHPAHRMRIRMLDAYSNAAERDADGEMAPPVDQAYYAAAYSGSTEDRMWLYREAAGFMRGRVHTLVEAWYFRCQICGLILPAQRTSP
jgi:hypothetical protein